MTPSTLLHSLSSLLSAFRRANTTIISASSYRSQSACCPAAASAGALAAGCGSRASGPGIVAFPVNSGYALGYSPNPALQGALRDKAAQRP
jgi:hypothetical protein